MITIKEFSKKVDYSIRMLRYLEEVGLVIPQRANNNYRFYSEFQISEVNKIKKLQNLGLQLKEIELLLKSNLSEQVATLSNALEREQEIAEIKSDSVPELKVIIDFLNLNKGGIEDYLSKEVERPKKMKTLGDDEKFNRTAYSVPVLKNIYEDHLTIDANIELIATDLLKFKQWYEELKTTPQVFSAFRESSFVFGQNITDAFIEGYETAWKKYLPKVGMQPLEGFNSKEVKDLMGPHDIIIRSSFKYKDTGLEGEIVIPYTPLFSMSMMTQI